MTNSCIIFFKNKKLFYDVTSVVVIHKCLLSRSNYQLSKVVYQFDQLCLCFGGWYLVRLSWIFHQIGIP